MRNCQLHRGLEAQGYPEGGAGDCRLTSQPYPYSLIENPTLEEDDEKSLIYVLTETSKYIKLYLPTQTTDD